MFGYRLTDSPLYVCAYLYLLMSMIKETSTRYQDSTKVLVYSILD